MHFSQSFLTTLYKDITEPVAKVNRGSSHGPEWGLLWKAPSPAGPGPGGCTMRARCCVNIWPLTTSSCRRRKCYINWLESSCYIWWLWIPRPPTERESFHRGVNYMDDDNNNKNNNNNNNGNSITVIITIAKFIVCSCCSVVRQLLQAVCV